LGNAAKNGGSKKMRSLSRILLVIVFFAAVGLTIFLLLRPKEKETWATLTGLLAVIAAVISAWPALRVLELQEDSSRPRPTPCFDVSSRYNLLQLRVKNIGGGVAYDVRLNWDNHPIDHQGENVEALDYISVLLPGESVSTLLGVSTDTVKKLSTTRFEGEVKFKNSNGKVYKEKFICSADAHQKRLVHDDELPKTLRDLQDIPKELGRINDALQRLVENQNGKP
jgi:hypothetical protein